jgi:hypothetical protein
LVSFEEAEHACRCFGWRLLDVTHHNIEDLSHLFAKCKVDNLGWIRSWFGFKGGECRAVIPFNLGNQSKSAAPAIIQKGFKSFNPIWMSAIFGENVQQCQSINLYALCQEDPKQPARPVGPVKPSVSIEYSTTTVATTAVSSFTTVTTTVTLLGQ